MGLLSKFKGWFGKGEISVPIEEPKPEETEPAKSGDICISCGADILEGEVIRVIANQKLHKRCAKRERKQAMRNMFG